MDVLVMVYGWFMGNIFFKGSRDQGYNCDLVTYVVHYVWMYMKYTRDIQ